MDDTLIINLKAYKAATGAAAKHLLSVFDGVDTGESRLIVAVNPVDIHLASATPLTVYAQHVDPVTYGSHTGHITPEAAKNQGCDGTLLNHSECKRDHDVLRDTLVRTEDAGLNTVVCASSLDELASLTPLNADAFAIEPPELIGGQTSVSTAEPELIDDAASQASTEGKPLLCGAGVKTAEDVRRAKDLGAAGVLVASGVVKAERPVQATENLLSGFND